MNEDMLYEDMWYCSDCGTPMHPPSHGCPLGPVAYEKNSDKVGWCFQCQQIRAEREERMNAKKGIKQNG